jgi:hypothetical protein
MVMSLVEFGPGRNCAGKAQQPTCPLGREGAPHEYTHNHIKVLKK